MEQYRVGCRFREVGNQSRTEDKYQRTAHRIFPVCNNAQTIEVVEQFVDLGNVSSERRR